MKHSQWLRLKAQADRIVAALRADDFQCRKHTHRLSWHFRKDTVSYTLAWLPAPVGDWSLLPNDGTPQREQLLSKIHSIAVAKVVRTRCLNALKGFATLECPKLNGGCYILEHQGCGRSVETHSGTSLQAFPAKGESFWNQQNYPWTLVRLLPNAQHYTVARFYSRTEAENHKRFLGKWMPAAEFEVIFDETTVTIDN